MSSPSISQEDEEPQSDGSANADDKPQESDEDSGNSDHIDQKETEIGELKQQEPLEAPMVEEPLTIVYQKRNILDLFDNISGARQFSRFTVLPENNVNCFFQNRAQYWRLSSAAEQTDDHQENCPCCDFFYPASTQSSINQGPKAFTKNALTDSLKTFLKANEQMTVTQNNSAMNQFSSTSHFGYPMQQLSPPQQRYPPANGTALALLHLMNNASKNATSAFQSWTNSNNSRGYGMYGKQF